MQSPSRNIRRSQFDFRIAAFNIFVFSKPEIVLPTVLKLRQLCFPFLNERARFLFRSVVGDDNLIGFKKLFCQALENAG